jgi:hypothetical protein
MLSFLTAEWWQLHTPQLVTPPGGSHQVPPAHLADQPGYKQCGVQRRVAPHSCVVHKVADGS